MVRDNKFNKFGKVSGLNKSSARPKMLYRARNTPENNAEIHNSSFPLMLLIGATLRSFQSLGFLEEKANLLKKKLLEGLGEHFDLVTVGDGVLHCVLQCLCITSATTNRMLSEFQSKSILSNF